MDKDEVIKRLCDLASKVGKDVFEQMEAHDCFCKDAGQNMNFTFSPKILQYIEQAVRSKVAEDKLIKHQKDQFNPHKQFSGADPW